MTARMTTATMDQAWEAAIAQADAITLSDHLWERPQVKGFTIDGPTSRDLDDAIWIRETEDGAVASIHIADVAELVTLDSAIDKVALARTQTKYLAWGNEPMIPRALSENLLSLLEDQRRPTLTIQVTLNEQAEIVETEIFESWLKSKKKFDYEWADIACQQETAKLHYRLKLCQTWAEKLSQNRQAHGAFGGLLSKSGILFDENGNVVIPEGRLFHSQMIIQEFMILANRAVAQWFADRDILALYRNHTARAIAPERADMMNALLTTGSVDLIRQKLQHWLNRATYDPTLIGHFALNLPAYCHFTSPIRRFPDLINHRIVKAKLHEKRHPYNRVELEQLSKYIAEVVLQEEKATAEFHKKRNQRRYSRQILDPEALNSLPENEFTNVLKHATRDGNIAPLREVAIARLKANQLTVQDLYMLLVPSGDRSLQDLVLEQLQDQVQDAPSLISIAINQEDTWENFEFVECENLQFSHWLEVAIGGQRYTTCHPAQDKKKQRSRHLACLTWLEAFVNGELVAPEQREVPKVEIPEEKPVVKSQSKAQPKPHPVLSKTLIDGQNTVGMLQQVCLGAKFELPTYEFSDAEEGFTCQCKVSVWGRSFEGQATASKKKRAKQLAAKVVLEQMQQADGERAIA